MRRVATLIGSPRDDRGPAKRLGPAAPHVGILLRYAAEHRVGRYEGGPHITIDPHGFPRAEQLDAIAQGYGGGETDLADIREALAAIEVRAVQAEGPAAARHGFRRRHKPEARIAVDGGQRRPGRCVALQYDFILSNGRLCGRRRRPLRGRRSRHRGNKQRAR
jgi:hypothetical protein